MAEATINNHAAFTWSVADLLRGDDKQSEYGKVIRLMVNLLFAEDDEALTDPGAIKTLFDPACGTGGDAVGGRGVPARAQPQHQP